jgi:hypothetical protein
MEAFTSICVPEPLGCASAEVPESTSDPNMVSPMRAALDLLPPRARPTRSGSGAFERATRVTYA